MYMEGRGQFPLPPHQVGLEDWDTSPHNGQAPNWSRQPPGRKSYQGGRPNLARIAALSTRLMAVERARLLGRKAFDHRAWALEQEARAWAERIPCRQDGGLGVSPKRGAP